MLSIAPLMVDYTPLLFIVIELMPFKIRDISASIVQECKSVLNGSATDDYVKNMRERLTSLQVIKVKSIM